jgi:DNA helicase HerA-like ATPase
VFKRLVQELQSVQISDAALFDPAADTLSVETLIGGCAPGKIPLVIVNTQSLGALSRIQAWVAHLLGCLARPSGARDELSTVLVLDDAELFLPAAGKAASKEPLRELLKQPRNAGLGVVLISQRPAELDHRSRELIYTWFLGRMQDAKTNDRLNPLFDRLPPIRSKLAALERTRFVMLQDRAMLDVERAPSLLRGESLADTELIALAAASRAPARSSDGAMRDDPDRNIAGRGGAPGRWAH